MPEIELTRRGQKMAQQPTAGGSMIVRYLHERGPADVDELSAHFNKRPRVIKKAVNKLAQRGLVQARGEYEDDE